MNKIVEARLQRIYETDGEVFRHPSLTIPDDSLSIQEILINFSRGTMPPISKTPRYANDEDTQAFLDTDHPLDGQTNDLSNREIAQNYYDALLDDTIRTHGAPFEEPKKPNDEPIVEPEPSPSPKEE